MFSRFLYPVRSRLILALLVPLLPILIAMVVIGWHSSQAQVQRANESTENYALIASGYQKDILDGLHELLTTVAETPTYRSPGEVCERSLNRIAARLSWVSVLAVTDRNGKIICGSGQSKGVDLSDRAYFTEARQTLQYTISDALTGKMTGQPTLVGAMPWSDDNGDFAGMVIAGIETKQFAEAFQELPLPAGSRYYVLDRTGHMLAGSGGFPDQLRERLASLPPLGSKGVPFIMHDEDMTRAYSGSTLERGSLLVLIGIPRKFFLDTDKNNLLVSILGPIAVLVVVIVSISFLGNRLISAPVTSLIRTARAYSRGDLTARPAPGPAGGEIKELSSTFADMADRIARREKELQDAIQRREAMLREIHHRVKNNLQIVISLINLQSKSVSIPAAQDAFTEIQTRMRALALVHRYLYESDDLQSVNIGAFLTELCSSLQLAYNVSPDRVTLEVRADAVWDISDRAIPLALFMTETISNALRHAFPEGRPGYIKVTLKALAEGRAAFSVEDNGVGIEAQPSYENAEGIFRTPKPLPGLGMSLTKAFARQVDGELTMEGPPGTVITLVFRSRPVPENLLPPLISDHPSVLPHTAA